MLCQHTLPQPCAAVEHGAPTCPSAPICSGPGSLPWAHSSTLSCSLPQLQACCSSFHPIYASGPLYLLPVSPPHSWLLPPLSSWLNVTCSDALPGCLGNVLPCLISGSITSIILPHRGPKSHSVAQQSVSKSPWGWAGLRLVSCHT